MYCKNCGHPLNPNTNCCENCGFKNDQSNTQSQVQYQAAYNNSYQYQPEVNSNEPYNPFADNSDDKGQVFNKNIKTDVIQKKVNTNIALSFITATISIFIFGWLSIVGFSLGVNAFRLAKKNNTKGKVLALLASIHSCIWMAIYFIFV